MFRALVVNTIFQSLFSIIGRQSDFATVFSFVFRGSWFVARDSLFVLAIQAAHQKQLLALYFTHKPDASLCSS
jgi:hypothetical protein